MPPRDVTISEDAYERLRDHVRADERFSDVVERLIGATTDPLDWAGAYPGLGEEVASARREFGDALR